MSVVRKGTKHDGQKPKLALIPKEAIWGMGDALTFGANKYGQHNFRNGLEYTALVSAAMRHLTAWVDGENIDSESGLSHLDHALASLAMLKYMEVNKPEMDDRYKPEIKVVDESFLKELEDKIYDAAKLAQERGR